MYLDVLIQLLPSLLCIPCVHISSLMSVITSPLLHIPSSHHPPPASHLRPSPAPIPSPHPQSRQLLPACLSRCESPSSAAPDLLNTWQPPRHPPRHLRSIHTGFRSHNSGHTVAKPELPPKISAGPPPSLSSSSSATKKLRRNRRHHQPPPTSDDIPVSIFASTPCS